MKSPSAQLFQQVAAPPDFVANELAANWFTWADDVRTALWDLSSLLPRLPRPRVNYFESTEYGYSIVTDIRPLVPGNLQRKLNQLASGFLDIATVSEVVLLRRILDEQIDGPCIASFFAWVRTSLVEVTGEPNAAIYAPLGAVGGTAQGDFPLHADLYVPQFLLNVFDRVPKDGSGASLFLASTELLASIAKLRSIPEPTRRRIRTLLCAPSAEDHYEEFYDLLHGEHSWTAELQAAMAAQTRRITLSRGMGYLVHDRTWLHGREAPSGRVTKNRLHRLIFDNHETLAFRGSGRT